MFEKELNEEDWRDESISDDQRLKNRRSAESSDVLKNSFKENE